MAERFVNNGNKKLMTGALHAQFEPSILHHKFDNDVNCALENGENIKTSFGIMLPRLPMGLSKDRMQQEMYTMGYKRVTKSEELAELSSKFDISKMDIRWLRSEDVHTRFFIQSFPRVGEDNLVVIFTINDEPDLIGFMGCASRDYINMNVDFKKAIDFEEVIA